EGAGIEFGMQPAVVSAGGNVCTVDGAGRIIDRRAGRISTEDSARLVAALRGIRLGGAELFVEPVREHRFVLVLRGEGLSDAVADTDPPKGGPEPLMPRAAAPDGETTAALVAKWVDQARK